jgi:hypothetical protein
VDCRRAYRCGQGTQTRSRSKTVTEKCGGTCSFALQESRSCTVSKLILGQKSIDVLTFSQLNCKQKILKQIVYRMLGNLGVHALQVVVPQVSKN